jgi:predicted RNA-binding protein with PIN domain
MPFIEQEAKSEMKTIDGKKVHVITPECEITLTNIQSGKEYMSDKEADDDVNDSNTDTKREHIRRDVHLKIAQIKLGTDTGEL